MPIQTPTSVSTYQSEILAALATTGITQLAEGGKARAFADIVGDVLGSIEANVFQNIANSLLPFATGSSLDLLGDIYGVHRIGESDASTTSDDSNFEFYVRTGTFGNINNGANIIIPAGVLISSAANNGPVYSIDQSVTLPSGSSSVFFSASSQTTGSGGNTPSGVISQSNFTNYAQSNFGTLLVTNNFGVVGGRDAETDDDYRYRINLKIQSRAGANQAALQFAILQVPGVQNVVFQSLAGTFICYVYGISPQVPSSLIQLVQDQINNTTAFPLTGLAVVPNLVGISLTTSIHFIAGISSNDQISIIQNAMAAAETYINNLPVGSPLVINQVGSAILNSDSRILDIGEPNQDIESIFIWRSRADGTRYSRFLVSNYLPALGERIITESSITTAINLIAD